MNTSVEQAQSSAAHLQPARRKHIPALDGLRGTAVLLVFILHYGGGAQSGNRLLRLAGIVIKLGWCGVTLFFVLSGFLITGILWDSLGSSHWWRNFYARRALRIFPLYYGCLILVVASAVLTGHARASLSNVWVYCLFLQNLPLAGAWSGAMQSPLKISHLWSLAVEEQFYLVWPVVLMRFSTLREARRWAAVGFFISAACRVALWHFGDRASGLAVFSRTGELAAGAWLALSLREAGMWNRLSRVAPFVAWPALAGFAGVTLANQIGLLANPWISLVSLPLITCFFAGLLVQALSPGMWSRVFSTAWLRWVGSISYGIYMYHVMLEPVFTRMAHRLTAHESRNVELSVRFLLAAVLSTLLAWLSFTYFESPFLQLRSRFQAARTREPALRGL